MRIRLIYSLLVFFVLGLNARAGGHEISFRIPSLAMDTLVLGHRFNASFIPQDTAILDAQGNGLFRGKDTLPHGMYLVYLPSRKFFDLLISEDQFFSFETDTLDFVGQMKIEGSAENEAFYAYQRYLKDRRETARALQAKISNAANPADSASAKARLDALNAEVTAHIEKLIAKNEDNFFGVFLRALQEVKVPDPPLDEQGNPIDPAYQYKYYKAHYFDNFDVSDVRLLRTPFYEQKIMTYIEKVAFQHPDSLIHEVNFLINASRADPQLFRYMLITLFNHFAKSQIMGMDAVYIHIAENYYIPEATWSDPEFIEKLKERVAASSSTLIGSKAENIELVKVSSDHFLAAMEDDELKKNPYVGEFFKLHNLDASYTILFFWEADCGHCKKAIKELAGVYDRMKNKGIEVVAVSTLSGEEGKVKWIDHVNEQGYHDWINAWNPYDFSYKQAFDIQSTPQLFVLDEEKKIVAKRIAPEQAEQIIESIMERDSN